MILILRALGVGDLAASAPALRGLRAAFPGETLCLATPPWLTPLVEAIGGGPMNGSGHGAAIDRIIPATELEPLTGAPANPQIAANLHGSGPESHRQLQALRPGKLWAFANRPAGHQDGPGWLDEEHEVHRWCRLVRYYGVPCDPEDLDLAAPDAEVTRGVTIIHPGAKSPARRWPPDRYASVARRLRSAGHRVLITGSAAEQDMCVRVSEAAGLGPGAVARTSLTELLALVAGARLVISGDTGIAHLATGYRTPSVTLFGPVSPARWGPPEDRPWHRPIWHGTRSERGDLPGPVHPALLAVTVDEVLAAAEEVQRAPR
ncbi:putative glycosyltransferase [Actinoplanes missouriensis 431]|uniref:Putative glycosyltransferase n=1 Tax=Actinoplanes missouriensis (strain ATCC 14538 / DSM 43046 / CBS 188.64 / JCM 3121 / NBRC 102363 / NCIMB 12654 / NRRL B-3342 / UNCC 431) TaxID=512565 RepID=I0HB43_ACTM4|nr:glycosyltransferase family 9 protein [Actinoplanes missouriensis]BAL90230.1 putative glycosyltransferase [Actinoplanes missouriensis 431]